jgi:hypothetical protein
MRQIEKGPGEAGAGILVSGHISTTVANTDSARLFAQSNPMVSTKMAKCPPSSM